MTNWHKRFMNLAHYVANWSKYPGRKVGAVITDDRHTVISVGYNGSPRGCDDKDKSKFTKKNKYLYAEHAERNAIYNASRCLVGTTIYSTLFPCAACARAIIQCGIGRIVTYRPDFSDESFGNHFKAALNMCKETNVNVIYLDITNKQPIHCANCEWNLIYYSRKKCNNCVDYSKWSLLL